MVVEALRKLNRQYPALNQMRLPVIDLEYTGAQELEKTFLTRRTTLGFGLFPELPVNRVNGANSVHRGAHIAWAFMVDLQCCHLLRQCALSDIQLRRIVGALTVSHEHLLVL